MIPVDHIPLAAIVDLVNEYADETRRVAGETGDPYPVVGAFEPFDAGRDELVTLANELHGVFADPVSAPDRLNRLADGLGLEHRLGADGRLEWMHSGGGSSLSAAAVAALVDFVDEAGSARLGICDADACVDVFVDTSPAANRAYCSPRCHSRTRVARWRMAHRHETSTNRDRKTS